MQKFFRYTLPEDKRIYDAKQLISNVGVCSTYLKGYASLFEKLNLRLR